VLFHVVCFFTQGGIALTVAPMQKQRGKVSKQGDKPTRGDMGKPKGQNHPKGLNAPEEPSGRLYP